MRCNHCGERFLIEESIEERKLFTMKAYPCPCCSQSNFTFDSRYGAYVIRLESDDARQLADLYLVIEDLEEVIQACDRMEKMDKEKVKDDLVYSSLWSFALTKYSRRHSTGKRSRITEDILKEIVIGTYSSVAFAKVYTTKVPVTAADVLNDRVLPFFEGHAIPVLRVLTDRGTEFCGTADKHPYELYLQLNDIEHTRTRAKSPQTNGICERVHQTILNEFYKVAFRKKVYQGIDSLQVDLDEYMDRYNSERTHQGKRCQGRTPMKTFLDGKRFFEEKNLSEEKIAA